MGSSSWIHQVRGNQLAKQADRKAQERHEELMATLRAGGPQLEARVAANMNALEARLGQYVTRLEQRITQLEAQVRDLQSR